MLVVSQHILLLKKFNSIDLLDWAFQFIIISHINVLQGNTCVYVFILWQLPFILENMNKITLRRNYGDRSVVYGTVGEIIKAWST